MKIAENSVNLLKNKGIYSITSKEGKRYIGSTKKSFFSRFKTHFEKLRCNWHPNEHLQNSWNKYGIDNFVFEVLEVIDNEVETREKYWIEFYESFNRERGYNINKNPEKSPAINEEVKLKISKTIKEKYRSGKMKPNSSVFKKGLIPWNKDKKYKSTDHLKVHKKVKGSRNKFIENMRNSMPEIEVYSQKGEYIGTWRSTKDIEEFSLKPDNYIIPYMNLRNKKGRNGFSPYLLQSVNILISCKTAKPYKGLIFKYKDQANLKQGELLETPTSLEDNQQPSLSSNTFEGSTTNSQIQTDNAEDSNRDTSALPKNISLVDIMREYSNYRNFGIFGDDIV